MKVVQALGWYFPSSTGGTEVYVNSVAQHLTRAGAEVAVAAPRAGMKAPERYTHHGIPVYRYPVPASATRAEARGEVIARGAEHLHRWLAVEKPDVVHFHTLLTGLELFEIEAARSGGARVLVTAHTSALGYLCPRGTLLRWGRDACDGITSERLCSACALQQRGMPRSAAWLLASTPSAFAHWCNGIVDHPIGTALGMTSYVAQRRARQRALFDRIDGFFVLTEWARRALLASGAPPEKVVLNRLGVERTENDPAPSRGAQRPLTIGFLGRLDPIKGLDVLLRALAAIPDVDVRLDVRGLENPEFPGVVAELASAAANDPRIRYGGPVARGDVSRVLTGWDVLCCPGKSLEGGPTVALEALAVGTPVITSHFGGAAEILTDGVNTRLLPPGDWRALATTMRELVERPELLSTWRDRLPRVRTMSDVAEQYFRAYRAA